jgi:hypothetical protein
VTVSWWAAADEPHSSGLAAGMQLPDPAGVDAHLKLPRPAH